MLRLSRILAVLLLLALAACGSADDTTATDDPDALPEWIVRVQPEPGSSATANTVVEVEHRIVETERFVRIVVDGTDMTASASDRAGILTFEGLTQGSHTVTVELVELPGDEAELNVIDSYTWSFDTL
ncbi:MAG: hypothetical protein R3290_02355 [Acidimicrobiia bacterium]|nr:hypothetical protein [Acidimicrobiia bacterium]